jgi:hypothetical protein
MYPYTEIREKNKKKGEIFKKLLLTGKILFSGGGALDPYFTQLKNITCTYTLVNDLFFNF